ncbi:MAG: DUF3248 domain-containing protein [Trueperaceae bacterium]|nr:MAG: DUF3248 domain-containing protein [Trueperaceae bacterium]
MKRKLEVLGIRAEDITGLASQLVWRLGRMNEEGPLIIRVGLASSVPLFSELPRLRSVSDKEIEVSIEANEFRVEWIGHKPT